MKIITLFNENKKKYYLTFFIIVMTNKSYGIDLHVLKTKLNDFAD